MAAVAARPLALRRPSTRNLSQRPESSKTPVLSKLPETSKTPMPSKPPKPKSVPRRNSEINSDKLSINPSSRISSLKTLKPNTPKPPHLPPRWNSSTKIDFDHKGSLRFQPSPRLPTIPETKQSKKNISSTEDKRGRNPAILSGSRPLAQTPKLAPPLSSQKPSKLNTPRRNPPKPTDHPGTPNLSDIPPVEVCDSPEIVKAKLAAPTMACFAAGHLLARVQDGRRCRPRGLLTFGGPVPEVIEEAEGLPPLIKASILWLSSPSGTRSSSVKNISQSLFRDDYSPKPPRDEELGCPSPVSEIPESPSTGSRFSTKGSTTSPFTLILKRAAAGHWGFLSPSAEK